MIKLLSPSHNSFTSRLMLFLSALMFYGILPAQGTGAGSAVEGGQQTQGVAPNQVHRLLEKTRRPMMHKRVDTNKPTVLLGEHGTELLIPPNAFVDQQGNPVAGEVIVNFTEVYEKSDLILSNLPTMSNGRMLESGGVVYIEAMADGEQLKLAEGKSVLINFPGGRTEGMEMFKGAYDAEGTMNWIPMADAAGKYEDMKDNLPTANTAAMPMMTAFGKADPLTFGFADGKSTVPGYLYAVLEKNYACRGLDRIYVEVQVDEGGQVSRAKTLTGKNACYRLAVEEAVKTIPWDVDKLNGRKTFYFELKPDVPATGDEGENLFASAVGKPMLTAAEIEETMAAYVDRERARNFTKEAFQVTSLGWINCDRFSRDPNPRVVATISLDDPKMSSNSKVFMVFEDMRSVIEAYPNGANSWQFSNIPENRKVKVVALSYMPGDGPYISVRDMKVKAGDLGPSAMKKTTVDQVDMALSRL
ncbi:MAG: hypothetical protein AAF570_07780 [Bacteroidota bacterium]